MKLYDKIVRPTTQMLLMRMETNPEDFDVLNQGPLFGYKSWSAVAKHGEFNFIERRLINRKAVAIRRKDTEQKILELLLDGQARQEPWEDTYSHTTHSTVGRFTGVQSEETNKEKRVVFSQAGLIAVQQTDPQKFAKVKKAYEEYYKAQKEE